MNNQSKLIIRVFILFFVSLTTNLLAEEFPLCESKLFDRLKLSTKETIALPKRDPKGDLLKYINQFEMLCPWQIERDFNNDNVKDWAGIISRNHQFQLVVYLSKENHHYLKLLKTYKAFPHRTFLDMIDIGKVINLTQNNTLKSYFKYAIAENEIKGQSNIYAWDLKKISLLHEYWNEIEVKEDDIKEVEVEKHINTHL